MDQDVLNEKIIAVRTGHKEVYLEIVRHFEPRLRAFIAARCYDRNLIQDLIQDTFIYAFEHLAEYRDGTNFQAWLYTVARFKVLAEVKHRQKRAQAHQRYCDFVVTTATAAESGCPDEAADAKFAALQACLNEAGEKVREFVKLRYKLNMNLSEIATCYARTESWAKSYSFRMKQALKTCIKAKLARDHLLNEGA